MKKHDLTPFLALFGLFLLFVGFVLLLVWGAAERPLCRRGPGGDLRRLHPSWVWGSVSW